MAVANELYAANPGWPEGILTQARAALVQEAALAEAARNIGLGEMLRMGRGEKAGGGRERPSNLSATLEAVIGAIFLDQGYGAARAAVPPPPRRPASPPSTARTCLPTPSRPCKRPCRPQGLPSPAYRIVHEEGADHDRLFVAEVTVDGKVAGRGEGKRKSLAEQAAAVEALKRIPFPASSPAANG